jgi:phage terminase large subunit
MTERRRPRIARNVMTGQICRPGEEWEGHPSPPAGDDGDPYPEVPDGPCGVRHRTLKRPGPDSPRIELVSPYVPRDAFRDFHRRKARWAAIVAHRRAGKTVACINELVMGALKCPLPAPRFAYIAPRLNQAKDIAWEYLKDFTRFIPGRWSYTTELWVELPGGARIRLYGTDNADRLRGSYFDGVVFDEFGDMDPNVWTTVVRPMLSDPGRLPGWACFIGTPKGRNGFYRLWTEAKDDPDWYRLELKATKTKLIEAKELADAKGKMGEDAYAQEYECSFDAAVRGAYWAREIKALEEAGKIGKVRHDPALPVHTSWDLGYRDSTVIWFFQVLGKETRVIDVVKGEGQPLGWYAQQLQERPVLHGHKGHWVWGKHYLPHDAAAHELSTGKTRVERLENLGIRTTIVEDIPVADGIQAVRDLLPMCWFDAEHCKDGLEALRMYRREYDSRAQELRAGPRHDWTSHYADAFRYFAVGHREMPPGHNRPIKRDTSWIA